MVEKNDGRRRGIVEAISRNHNRPLMSCVAWNAPDFCGVESAASALVRCSCPASECRKAGQGRWGTDGAMAVGHARNSEVAGHDLFASSEVNVRSEGWKKVRW